MRTMMSSRKQQLRTILALLCVILISIDCVESFQAAPTAITTSPSTRKIPSNENPLAINYGSQQDRSLWSTELSIKKKKAVEQEPEREKNDGIGLFFLYMTPWKNPNSIFVYMLVGLYFLGKYSESQHIVRASTGL